MSRRQRLALVAVLIVGTISSGFLAGFGNDASPEPAVESFLLDWQQGQYSQAAALTTGNPGRVTAQLAVAYSGLDASGIFFDMESVSQHGATATASFKATVDFADGEDPWTYTGRFSLTTNGGHWFIDWMPGVINPSLGTGERLIATTTRVIMVNAAGQAIRTLWRPPPEEARAPTTTANSLKGR